MKAFKSSTILPAYAVAINEAIKKIDELVADQKRLISEKESLGNDPDIKSFNSNTEDNSQVYLDSLKTMELLERQGRGTWTKQDLYNYNQARGNALYKERQFESWRMDLATRIGPHRLMRFQAANNELVQKEKEIADYLTSALKDKVKTPEARRHAITKKCTFEKVGDESFLVFAGFHFSL